MIRSREIQSAVSTGETVDLAASGHTLDLGEHQLPISDTIVALDPVHTDQIKNIIAASLDNYPKEDTLVQDKIGRPTIIARVDCSIGADGILPYECDDRPAGWGVQDILSRHHLDIGIANLLQDHSVATLGSELVVVRHPEAKPNDDHVVLDVLKPNQLNGHAVIARGEPGMFTDEELYRELARRSASTIRTEGDKSYALAVPDLGARLIHREDELPEADQSFALKSLQGSKCSGVAVYLAGKDRAEHGKRGTITHSRMQRIAQEMAPLILEKFKPPIRTRDHGNMILRVNALISASDVQVIGGAYVARPEMLVHGASNAIAGLITVEEGKLKNEG
jgi:hypothetical protein